MKGIILIEGADSAGKTTLAKHIFGKFPNAEYVHLGKPNPGHAWQEHRDALLAAIKSMRAGKLVVIDRQWLSEAVYGQVYRDGSEYPFAARHIDRLLYRFGALRVICAPPIDYIVSTHKRMVQEREEMYVDRMHEIAKRYLDVWYGTDTLTTTHAVYSNYLDQLSDAGGVADKLGWEIYDVTVHGQDMESYVAYLISQLAKLRDLLPNFNEGTDNWTGWPRRQAVMLVGDKSSKDDSAWPFLSNTGSSLYLAKILNNLQADESRVCIVNATGPDGLNLLRQGKIHCGRVIAMGRVAEQALEKERIVYDARVRHPQHARRFTSKDGTYELELREAFSGMAGVLKKDAR